MLRKGYSEGRVYIGEQIQGYWPKADALRWRPASVADTRLICGPTAQVWYGVTWVYVPKAVAVNFAFQGHEMTYCRWFLNQQKVAEGDTNLPDKSLTLKTGWNQIMFRGYCVGYPPFRVGLVFNGQAANLWQLRLSQTPPPQ